MGTDCALFIAKEEIYLDRWWVFSDHFRTGFMYPKKEALNIITKLKNDIENGEHYMLGHASDEDKQRHLHWVKLAFDSVNKSDENSKIVICHENDPSFELFG